MPKGFGRPRDQGGVGNEQMREAAASGKASNYTSAKITDQDFQREMRMRERAAGTSDNEGYLTVGSGGLRRGDSPIDPNKALNTEAPEAKANAYAKQRLDYAKGGMVPKTFGQFEKSGMDKDPKGMKEGSKKEEAFDKRQFAKLKRK